ncbi:MAG: diguanylate cyclase [Leptolyngbya sp. DLM2.Bin27]|nr:MAG: diguanylate cyclase [Leptolyngbya sp. DLM2.Bin27]
MDLSPQIEAVYQRVTHLRQKATETWSQPPEIIDDAFGELYGVLEELGTAQEELQRQNRALLDMQQTLQQEQRRYQDLFNLAPDGYVVLDRQGVIQSANRAMATLLKVPQAELQNKPLAPFIALGARPVFFRKLQQLSDLTAAGQPLPQAWQVQLCPRHSPAVVVSITLSAMPTTDGTVVNWLWLLRDITQQKQTEALIHRQAFYDALTGLPNRALFDDRLPQALNRACRRQDQLAVVFLDLDRFKLINDSLGHSLGDAVLQAVATRLRGALRSQDTIARWGGDEFTLILHPVESAAAVAQMCDRILASLKPPLVINGHHLQVSLSFGIALFPQDSDDPETLVRYADIALYQAKTQDCGYRFYNAAIDLQGQADRPRTQLHGEAPTTGPTTRE